LRAKCVFVPAVMGTKPPLIYMTKGVVTHASASAAAPTYCDRREPLDWTDTDGWRVDHYPQAAAILASVGAGRISLAGVRRFSGLWPVIETNREGGTEIALLCVQGTSVLAWILQAIYSSPQISVGCSARKKALACQCFWLICLCHPPR
jgi:hypothetical protein